MVCAGIAVLLLTMSGCLDPNDPLYSPPYVVTRPECIIGERLNYYQFAGLEFSLLNTGGKDISRITVSFMLFDAVTEKSPFFGTNLFRLTILGTVYPNERYDYVISLDPYIYQSPSEPYIVDHFYIAEIVYSDGTSWRDDYGMYHTGG
jgi:hypothetical protein